MKIHPSKEACEKGAELEGDCDVAAGKLVTSTILPCPFCGTLPEYDTEENFKVGTMHHLSCQHLNCEVAPYCDGYSKEEVIKYWNTRADGINWPPPYDIGGDTEAFIQALVEQKDHWIQIGMNMMTQANGEKNRSRKLEKEIEHLKQQLGSD